jgi:dihydroorotate dehydrogenase
VKLRGVKFKNAFNAPGILGLYGEGFWFHEPLKGFGLDFRESTFISRVITLSPKSGNMELDDMGIHPRKWIPDEFRIDFRRKFILNHLGIGNPGIHKSLEYGFWQKREEPFIISFAAVGKTISERIQETREFVDILIANKNQFKSRFGIQLNFFHDSNIEDMFMETIKCLHETNKIDAPIICRFNPLISVDFSIEIAKRKGCDAISISHPIRWGSQTNHIKWKELFNTTRSPLEEDGGGWLSGEPLVPIYNKWISKAMSRGISKPIITGGAMTRSHIKQSFSLGARAIEIGSISFLRPWRVRNLIRYANDTIIERLYNRGSIVEGMWDDSNQILI